MNAKQSLEIVDTAWHFLPVSLCRRCSLPWRQLSGLVPNRTWQLLQARTESRAIRNTLQETLLAALYRLVPGAPPAERRALIALQRDLHNDRLPAPRLLDLAQQRLDASQYQTLMDWVDRWNREENLLQEARAALHAEIFAARQQLARLASSESFQRGIQLSGAVLRRNMESFVKAVAASEDIPAHVLRKTEGTLISFLYRMALKPSPFASFVEIVAQRWDSPGEPGATSDPVHIVRLSMIMLRWMERELTQIEEYRARLPIWLNNTVRCTGNTIEFFTRGADGSEQMFRGERFVSLPTSTYLRSVLEALRQQTSDRTELVACLMKAGAKAEQAGAFVERLVEIGLLERGLGLPDQERHYARRMAEQLASFADERAQRCAALLMRLADIEQEFAAAPAKQRNQLLAEIQDHLRSFVQILDIQEDVGQVVALLADDTRSLLFEDVGSVGTPHSWCPASLEAEKENLAVLSQLLPLFDEALIERVGLYEYFASLYGPEGVCDDILDFYRHFAKLDSRAVSTIMAGADNPHVRTIKELRRAFCEHLRERLHDQPLALELELDQEWTRQFIQQFPAFIAPWQSMAYRLQFIGTPHKRGGLVINGITTGYGAAFSRFCDLFDLPAGEQAWSLGDEVSQAIRRRTHDAEQVDITTVLGVNTNLHPRLTRLEIEYPRSRSIGDPEGVLSLRDVRVVADAGQKRLVLYSKRDGQRLNLVPLNFLFPSAAPNLYRFLCVFAPFVSFRTGFWSRYLSYGDESEQGRTYFPRLKLGNVVIERQTWAYRVDTLDRLDVQELDDMELLLAAQAWRARLALPHHGFFRFIDMSRPGSSIPDWIEMARNWAMSARRARLRKPHYLDFANPFLLKVFFKQLGGDARGTMMFQECLPAIETYLDYQGPTSAEEFVVELSYEGEDTRYGMV